MKKTLLYSLCSLAFAAFALPAWGQQINGDFETWEDCIPWQSDNNTTVVGIQPKGWRVSNVTGAGLYAQMVAEKNGGSDGHENAVKLTNKSALNNGIPAYLTLGTPWATSKGSFKVTDTDGGTWGGISFVYKPDSITFDYKKNDVATVVAYLWNGTWVQKDVPGVCVTKNGETPKSVDMENRDRNILNLSTSKGGAVTQKGTLVASLNVTMPSDAKTDGKWSNASIAFDYADKNANVSMLNVIFAANDYFGERSNIKKDKYLVVDNVRLVYCHSLVSCQYDGSDVAFNNNNKAVVIAPDGYDANKLAYTVKGVGATVEKSYDNSTDELTITVKGNDYVANSKSFTTYTIQFVKSSQNYTEDLNLCVFGEVLGPMSATVTVQTRYDGKFNFQLKNFALGEDGPVGTINVYGLERDGDAFSAKSVDAIISEGDYEADWMLAGQTIPLDIKGHFVGDDHLRVGIDIELAEDMVVNVALGYSPAIANMAVKAGNQYGTFYAPFDVTPTVGVKAYTCEALNGSTLVLSELTDGVIPAKTAVVVERTDGSDAISLDFYNFDEDLKLENGHTGLLYGAAEGGTTIVPYGSYVLQNQDGNEKFFLVTEKETGELKATANRCWLQLPVAAGVKSLSLTTDATAIDVVKNLLNGKSEIYDLQGRRLPALQKGINIVNGKRVLVK